MRVCKRLVWHGAAGFGMGAACTIATVPFTTGTFDSDRHVAVAMLFCSTLLSGLCGLASAWVDDDRRAIVLTGCLAPFAGVANAISTYVLSQTLGGHGPGEELGLVVIFGIPYGGIPGCFYALPLAFAVAAARRALRLPAGTRAAGGRLVLGLAAVAVVTGAFARLAEQPYSMWPVIRLALATLGALAAATGLRDLWLAGHLRRRVLEEHPLDPAEPLEGIGALAPALGPAVLDTVLWAPAGQSGDGPYRAAPHARPVLVLPGSRATAVRRLAIGGALLLAMALALALLAG